MSSLVNRRNPIGKLVETIINERSPRHAVKERLVDLMPLEIGLGE
jgi:hypothetical protein